MQALTVLEATPITSLDAGIMEIASALRLASKSFLAAGKAYVALLEAHPREVVERRMQEMIPSLSQTTLRRLENVVHGTCDERLVLTFTTAQKELAQATVFEQRRALDEGIDFLTTSGEVVKLAVDAMRPEQVKQTMSMGHIRTIEEQRAYVASSAVKRQDKPKGKAYVENGKLHVTGKCTLSRYELATIMAQMG